MLTDKQKQMLLEAEKTMAQQKKAEDLLLQVKLEKQRRKDVFDAIQKLIDPVNEKTLLEQLPVIDTNSWPEVIEERYISKPLWIPSMHQGRRQERERPRNTGSTGKARRSSSPARSGRNSAPRSASNCRSEFRHSSLRSLSGSQGPDWSKSTT
ncbi:hypothetical protein L596_029988 [Steinernema carpocapsae]|uniref:Uncharacterized protein n=1 Tax=Steinernema carpocapsae TaxID=34508 RepID=A0A4U5LRE3_STECR|nr:hypothetical protein L596_029988 [Steinernema carpocapsae]